MTVEDIEEAILRLAPTELAQFRVWFAEFETRMAPPAMPESNAVRLGWLTGRAVAEIRKRIRDQ